MRNALGIALCAVLLIGAAVSAVPGRYVEVEVEVFESWGFLTWGAWKSLPIELSTTKIEQLPEGDIEGLALLTDGCGTDITPDQQAACGLLGELEHTLLRTYRLAPLLGLRYRVALTNVTESFLGVVLGVDGLNSNGNQEIVGDASDRKWILLPGQTVHISGWQISEDEALAFVFTTPSLSHVALPEERGRIDTYVYLMDPFGAVHEKGTGAGEIIDQPTVRIPFESATSGPIERLSIDYGRDRIALGIHCEETDGPGIRILNVVEGTAAARKGLKAGDVITYADARPIESCADLQEVLSTKVPGDRIILKVHRPDRVFLLAIELEE